MRKTFSKCKRENQKGAFFKKIFEARAQAREKQIVKL